jgi:hypothetical protein
MKRKHRYGLAGMVCLLFVGIGAITILVRVNRPGARSSSPSPAITKHEPAPQPTKKAAVVPPPRFTTDRDPAPGFVVVPKTALPDGNIFPAYRSKEAYEIKVGDYAAVPDVKN